MRIRQYVSDLHPGQIATLILAAVIASTLLAYARVRVVERAHAVANAGARLRDSELTQLSQRRTSLDIQIGNRELLDPSFKGSNQYDSLKKESARLDSLWLNRLAQPTRPCRRCESQLALITVGLVVIVAITLWILWTWFGARRLTSA